MVPADKLRRVLDAHSTGLTGLARRVGWLVKTTGNPDATKAGLEVGVFKSSAIFGNDSPASLAALIRLATSSGSVLGRPSPASRIMSDPIQAPNMVWSMRSLIVGVLALACLAIPEQAAAQPTFQDSVTGGGTAILNFTISAHSGPLGESAGGTLEDAFTLTGVVTCLNVKGNRATVGFSFGPEFAGLTIVLTDNGPPEAGRPVDTLTYSTFTDLPPTACPDPNSIPGQTDTPFTAGDIVIVDSQPPPTAKSQCANRGWRQYGFRNQGQCVAFVERGPGR
jgi:hypothetical protein